MPTASPKTSANGNNSEGGDGDGAGNDDDTPSRELTPNVMMTKNILKNTRKMTLFAKALGMMPRKVVIAPTTTDGPISPRARAMRKSLAIVGS